MEPICHLDDIVQCLWWLITTADTCTAPERVFHTCTYFSLLNLWSEWELAGRNFSAILKMRSGLVSLFGGLFVCFLLARFVACFARFLWLFFLGFFFPFGGFLGLVCGGFETRLDQQCHSDDIVRCPGWLITTADTLHAD